MPTSESKCNKCGHEFEVARSMTAPALEICPKELCPKKKWGRGRVSKQVGGGAGLIFKGSGFYITDYRSKNYTESAKKDSAPAKTPGGDAKPVPAKPAAKADKK